MATTTQTKTGIPSFDAAFDQFREGGEQVLTATRKAGNLYLDTYEKAVDRTTDLQLKLLRVTHLAPATREVALSPPAGSPP